MIDWFTTTAQIVNFLILVVLLRYLLYGRILAAVESREAQLRRQWEEAEQVRREAKRQLAEVGEERRRLEEGRERWLAEARQEVEEHRRQLLLQVRQDIEQQQRRWREALRAERQALRHGLQKYLADQVLRAAERVVADLAGVELEQQIIRRFIEKLKNLPEPSRQELIESMAKTNNVVTVHTAFVWEPQFQKQLEGALEEILGISKEGGTPKNGDSSKVALQIEKKEELVCGIVLQTDAYQLAWNVAHYFQELREHIQTVIDRELADSSREPDSARSHVDEQVEGG